MGKTTWNISWRPDRFWSGAGHLCALVFHGIKAPILIGFCDLRWLFEIHHMEKGLRDRQWSMTGGSSVCVTCSVRHCAPQWY